MSPDSENLQFRSKTKEPGKGSILPKVMAGSGLSCGQAGRRGRGSWPLPRGWQASWAGPSCLLHPLPSQCGLSGREEAGCPCCCPGWWHWWVCTNSVGGILLLGDHPALGIQAFTLRAQGDGDFPDSSLEVFCTGQRMDAIPRLGLSWRYFLLKG